MPKRLGKDLCFAPSTPRGPDEAISLIQGGIPTKSASGTVPAVGA
jgi:hypothetical protein